MTDRDRCMAPCIALRVLLLCVLAAAEWPSVQVVRTAHVQRGLTTDIRAALSLREYDLRQLTHCSVRQVPHSAHLSCGDLRPSSLRCDEPDPLIYRHYGCPSKSELLHLQLLASRNSSTIGAEPEQYIHCITVEVAVRDSFIRPVRLQTSSRVSGGYEYTRLTPVFPPEWVGSCYYRIVRSLLPTAEVQGMIGTALPCGYVPREPFQLVRNSKHNTSILLEVTSTSPDLPDTIHVLLSADPPQEEDEPPPHLPSTSLEILQFSNTPVPADLLSCPHPRCQCVYVFPVLEAGVFVPAYSPPKPLTTHTKFTSEDVAAGSVAFIPNEDSLTSTFNYTIMDFTGNMLGQSAVEVSILQRNWDLPGQRVDCGLQVAAGGQAYLDSSKLQFYIPNGSFCWQNTTLSLSQGPHKGRWVFVDGRALEAQDTFPHTYLANRMLAYHHTSGGSDVVDSTVWQVSCGGDSFQVHFSILIAPSNERLQGQQVPRIRVEPSMLITFCGMASPLLLDATNVDPSLAVELDALEGSVIRLARPNMLIGHPFPPYVALPSLGPQESITSFTIQDMWQRLIWYIPTCSASHPLGLRLTGQASPALPLQVLNSTVSIQNFFLLTVSAGFLKIVQNKPLPVNSHFPVYLSPYFLYASSHMKQPSAVTYHIETPPKNGHICLATAFHCNSSLSQFTQNSLEEYKIIYKPDVSRELVNDSFRFHLGFRNVEMVTPLPSTFQIYAVEPRYLLPPEDQFWVGMGGNKSVPLRHFRPFYYRLRKKNVTFNITSLPQHGELIMNSRPDFPFPFTFADLNNRSLQYRHRERGSHHCSDTFTFVASNSTHSLSSTVTIAIRQRERDSLGVESPDKTVLDQTNFVLTSRDLHVFSDFCPPFVHFKVRATPTSGVLRLFQPAVHTYTQLGNGSVFTEEDVMADRLWYSIYQFDSNMSNMSDAFLFNVSDPRQPNAVGPRQHNEDYFQLTFQLMFLQPNEAPININATFNIHAAYVLSWLPEHQTYGYIFQPDDIQVDSTPDLRANHINVKILIKRFPERGWIMMDSSKVTEFYLSHILEGRVRYEPIEWWMFKVSSDSFTMSVLFETNNTAVFTLYNHSMTLLWSWVHPPHTSYFVQESARELTLTLRRNLEYDICPDYTSNLTLSLTPVTATVSDSCEGNWEGDICINALEVAFPPGNCSQNLTLEIAQDNILEREEYFLLDIVNCSNCVTDRKTMNITISDQDDYAYVEVEAHSPAHPQDYCSRELDVQEAEGEILLTLTRTGNMEHEVNISCYTRSNTATPHEDFEPLSPNTTVTFKPNQTTSHCVVIVNDDALNEGKERFYVFLMPVAGLVETGQSQRPLCIYIVYDRNDAPILTFPPWPLIVQESEMRNVLLNVSFLRSGESLESNTTVCFIIMNDTFTTATTEVDYRLANSRCVTFGREETVVNISLIVYPDDELEGEEYVFLELQPQIKNGVLGQPFRLNITIVDGTDPAYVGLSSTEFHINESTGFVPFPVIRNGSIDGITKILCKLKPINTTTTPLVDPARADFIVPQNPETITFKPSNTTQYCHILLNNDDVYEEVEGVYLMLDYSPLDPGVIIMPTRQRAIIYIHDFDDEPKVWFNSSNHSIQEPLSNFDVDRRCANLTVVRGGDLSTNFTLSYVTKAGSATPNRDYIAVNGTAHFDAEQDSLLINVPILANEEHVHLQWVNFTVHLMAQPPVRVIEPQKVVISIFNTPVTGVLFPAQPVLASLAGNGTYLTGERLFYDAPVVCVDPCDPDYQTITGISYTEYCNHQQIDSNHTEYTWNLSSDGLSYQQVRQATTFTSYEGKVLEPLYLENGVYVSCSTQAVTTSGTQGNTRTSNIMRLSRSTLPRDRCEDATPLFQLYKYDGFTGHPEELLKLSITLPNHDNHIPLVSTRPFQPFDDHLFLSLLTRPRDRDMHSCSNLVDSGPQKTSFLSPLPTSSSASYSPSSVRTERSMLFYQHFSSSECRWHFELWLPLAVLTNSTQCGAQLSESGQVWTLVMPLHYAYVHIRPNGDVSVYPSVSYANTVQSSYTSMVRATWSSGQELSVPFNTFSSTGGSTYIYPIMTQYRGSLTVLFYSVAESGEGIDHVEVTGSLGNTSIPRPLYSSSPASSEIHQAWRLEVSGEVETPVSVTLDLWPLCSGSCASLSFFWYISATDNFGPRIAPQMEGVLDYNVSDKTTANSGLVTGAVWLETYFQLRSDYAINLETATLYLCTDSANDTACTSYSHIWIMVNHDMKAVIAAGFDMKIAGVTASSINFTFKAEPLHELGVTGPFQLEIKCSIQRSSGSHLTKSPVHALILPLHFSSPDGGSDPTSPSSGGVSKHVALLASAIAIFMTAVVLVAIVMMTVALLWRWQARRRSSLATQVKKTEEEVRNSERPRRPPRSLRKSASTTSFPTVEKMKKQLQSKAAAEEYRVTSQKTGQIDHGAFLSKSLPNLSLAFGKEGPREAQKRQLRKPASNVRVKFINTHQANLNMWQGKGKREEKEVGVRVIKNILHIAPVAQVQPRTGELANYAVRSIAASAITPEPGSGPATEL